VAAQRRTGRLGDGWLSNTWKQPARFEKGVERIREEAEKSGRSMDEITVSCKMVFRDIKSERISAVRKIEKLQDAGVSHFIVDFEHESASDYARKIKSFSKEIMRSF
jgi:alkanesulfonate monooxygenase SsuD/methylene tetrahydromethanopterin reductase-like flavin-dependent oxidoreductase (luciferase family)